MWHLCKKKYKGIHWDKIFGGCLSVVIVLETNLISHTLEISVWSLKLIAILTACLLLASVLKKTMEINADVQKEKRKIVSKNAENAFFIVRRLGWTPFVPLILLLFSENGSKILFWFLISALLLLIVKFYFDDIVTFTDKGYSSGFDEIELSSDHRIEIKNVKSELYTNEMYEVNVYKNDIWVGKDVFVKEDGLYLYHYMR